eukprot:1412233-Lingulodinium_polyedra.AAC.1
MLRTSPKSTVGQAHTAPRGVLEPPHAAATSAMGPGPGAPARLLRAAEAKRAPSAHLEQRRQYM